MTPMNTTTSSSDVPPRKISFDILRYNPQDPATAPRMQTYRIEEAESMTLFIALNEIRGIKTPPCNSISFAVPGFAAVAR